MTTETDLKHAIQLAKVVYIANNKALILCYYEREIEFLAANGFGDAYGVINTNEAHRGYISQAYTPQEILEIIEAAHDEWVLPEFVELSSTFNGEAIVIDIMLDERFLGT